MKIIESKNYEVCAIANNASSVFKEFNKYISLTKQQGIAPKKFIFIRCVNSFAYRFNRNSIDVFTLHKNADVNKVKSPNNAGEVSIMKTTIEKLKKNEFQAHQKKLTPKSDSRFWLSKDQIEHRDSSLKFLDKSLRLTNKTASKVESARKGLFRVVRVAVEGLRDNEHLLNEYKKRIVQKHRSTVYLMIKVASEPVLIKNKKKLPTSYQTLYECLKLLKEVEKAQFEELIETEKLNQNSSKADVIKLRNASKIKANEAESDTTSYKKVLEMSMSLSPKEKLNVLECLLKSITDEERQSLKIMYLDRAA